MILLGLGANLPTAEYGAPVATFAAAIAALAEKGISCVRQSPWYRSAPLPAGDQPWYVNGVVAVATLLAPAALLSTLHLLERRFGRERRARNEARVLDLDLLDYDGLVVSEGSALVLPHPRLHQRAFVLLPLRDVAPLWRHPRSGESVEALIAALPPGQQIDRLE
jgi:2-amino-4-hydroxy-6-hydroxymethyldihydropteridine diphosphokinase